MPAPLQVRRVSELATQLEAKARELVLSAKVDKVIDPLNTERVIPDMGDTRLLEKKTAIDKAQDYVETADGIIANTGAAANIAVKAAQAVSPGSAVGRAAARATGVAARFEPVQAALWGVDAARAVVDEGYRKRHLDTIESMGTEKGRSFLDADRFSTSAAVQAFEHPIATGGAMIRYAGETRRKEAENRGKEEDYRKAVEAERTRMFPKRASFLDVPKVDMLRVRELQRDQAVKKLFRIP